MELKYAGWIAAGIIIIIFLALLGILFRFKKESFKAGIKVANLDIYLENSYYKKKLWIYRICQAFFMLSICGGILASCYLLARPFHTEKHKEDQYNRDIIICLDVSTSVNDLNVKLVKELENTVRELHGERIGIVIFNTSPLLLSPLTDDYEFIIEQLQNIGKAIKSTDSDYYRKTPDDYFYWYNFLMSGTLVGNEEHGSSLIGDGLAGAAFSFPKTKDNRSRSIIFATDNDLYGTPYATLMDAAKLCKRNEIVVYGIGTKAMYQKDIEEMSQAMELTGGAFYLEENASAFHQIVEDIESKTASRIPGKTLIREVEEPTKGFYILIGFTMLFFLISFLLWEINTGKIIKMIAMILLLVIFLVSVIIPSKQQLSWNNIEQKSEGDLQVLFVVDNTISMLAQDYDGDKERLEGVYADCDKIIEGLEGAKFSVISFQNTASILSPFTRNVEHTKGVIHSIYPMSELYATGTSLNYPKEPMKKLLEEAKRNEKQKMVVFFISDGEVTDGSSIDSYADLAGYIDGGAVLGYGTAAGGKMEVMGRFDEEKTLVLDETFDENHPAISKINEKNLQKIANQMNIEYINMNGQKKLDSVVDDLKRGMKITTTESADKATGDEMIEPYPDRIEYWLMLPVLLIWISEGLVWVRKKV